MTKREAIFVKDFWKKEVLHNNFFRQFRKKGYNNTSCRRRPQQMQTQA